MSHMPLGVQLVAQRRRQLRRRHQAVVQTLLPLLQLQTS
jgi:hypothetical protein